MSKVAFPATSGTESRRRRTSRIIFAAIFIAAGTLHFAIPSAYMRIMPPYLPRPLLLIYISGVAEFAGGLGLLVRALRKAAAWGLFALLIAVWPANIYMATAHLAAPGIFRVPWVQWLRVALQIPMIAWAWLYTRD